MTVARKAAAAWKRSSLFTRLIHRAGVLLLVTGFAASAALAADALDEPYPYQASEADVRQVLADLTRRTGYPALVHEAVRGSVTIANGSGNIADLLDEAASQTRAIWWFDGLVVRFEPSDGLTTAFLDSRGIPVERIRAELQALDLFDPRFPLRASADAAVIRVTGPAGYVEQVTAVVARLVAVREGRRGEGEAVGLFLPRIYHGRTLQ